MTSGTRRRSGVSRDIDELSHGDLGVSERTNAELRDVQVALANAALELEASAEDLRAVLEIMGLLRRFDYPRPSARRATASCEPWTGTLRGYRYHLRASSTPCPACTTARTDELRQRWADLGINTDEVVMPS